MRVIAQVRYSEPSRSGRSLNPIPGLRGWLREDSSLEGFITPNAVYVAIYEPRRKGLLGVLLLEKRGRISGLGLLVETGGQREDWVGLSEGVVNLRGMEGSLSVMPSSYVKKRVYYLAIDSNGEVIKLK